jgi:hypothetical protein
MSDGPVNNRCVRCGRIGMPASEGVAKFLPLPVLLVVDRDEGPVCQLCDLTVREAIERREQREARLQEQALAKMVDEMDARFLGREP